ncbi:MAG: hypothetical protein RR957_03450, partial [Oscillospiraceae bacterium]
MKRIICMLLFAAIIVGSTGCVKQEPKQTGDEIKLTWLLPGDTQSGLERVMEEANKIIKREIGATVEIQ